MAVEKLTKNNSDSWQLQIEPVLVKNYRQEYVTNKEIKPAKEP